MSLLPRAARQENCHEFCSPKLKFDVDVFFDPEANVWRGQYPEAGIFTEGNGWDNLRANFRETVALLLEDRHPAPSTTVYARFMIEDVPFTPAPGEISRTAHI
jgi:hypothetical protein